MENDPPSHPPPLPARAPTPRPEARPKKKRRWWLIVLLVVGIPVGGLATLYGCWELLEATAKKLPVKERDREVLVTAAYAAGWLEYFEPDPRAETITKKRYIDGSHELAYEYEHPSEDEGIYIHCVVTVEKTASDAKAVYFGIEAGTSIGVAWEDIELEDRPDLLRYGSKSRCALFRHADGGIVGNYFLCRSGRRVFEFSLVGLYFDEAGPLREFLQPVLRRVDTYVP